MIACLIESCSIRSRAGCTALDTIRGMLDSNDDSMFLFTVDIVWFKAVWIALGATDRTSSWMDAEAAGIKLKSALGRLRRLTTFSFPAEVLPTRPT